MLLVGDLLYWRLSDGGLGPEDEDVAVRMHRSVITVPCATCLCPGEGSLAELAGWSESPADESNLTSARRFPHPRPAPSAARYTDGSRPQTA
jgi:hypothetical protein